MRFLAALLLLAVAIAIGMASQASAQSPTPSKLDATVTRITAEIREAVNAMPPGDLITDRPNPSLAPATANLTRAIRDGLSALAAETVPECLTDWFDLVSLSLRLLDRSIVAVAEKDRVLFAATGPIGWNLLTITAPVLRKGLCDPPPEEAA